MGPTAVCYQAEVAAVLNAAGFDVVLCGPEGAALGAALADRRVARPEHGDGGRLAVLVGQPADVEVEARVMARELFGAQPVVVRSAAEAQAAAAAAPASVAPAPPGIQDR